MLFFLCVGVGDFDFATRCTLILPGFGFLCVGVGDFDFATRQTLILPGSEESQSKDVDTRRLLHPV